MRALLTSFGVILATMVLIDGLLSEGLLGEFRLQHHFADILFIAFATANLPRLLGRREVGR